MLMTTKTEQKFVQAGLKPAIPLPQPPERLSDQAAPSHPAQLGACPWSSEVSCDTACAQQAKAGATPGPSLAPLAFVPVSTGGRNLAQPRHARGWADRHWRPVVS